MGSCLGPTLANVSLCHHETKWLNKYHRDFKSRLYRSYIDILFIFEHSQLIPKFINYLNYEHFNIEFVPLGNFNTKYVFILQKM